MSSSALMPTYARQPISFVRGSGCWLHASDGRRYLDALTGIAVCGLGHAHPVVAAAIADQAATLVHTSNLYQVPLQEELGQALRDVSGMELCFFSNSGAEANEAAIKLARLYGHQQRDIAEPAIIVMENSFHGRTLATLSATGNRKVQIGFEPLVQGFVRVPFDDVAAVEAAIAANPNVVAVLVEPVQGEGGIRVPSNGMQYLEALRQVCDQHNLLLMLDEIQTGNGRTGKYFAYQHTGIKPDVVTTAKGLGNGFPIGACLVAGRARDLFKPGNHGSTYGGTPLACRAALTVVQELQRGVIDNVPLISARMLAGFREQLAGLPVEVNGFGLLIGLRLPAACGELVALARDEEQLLLNVTADRVVRLLPTLNLTPDEADEIVTRTARVIRKYLSA